MRRMSFATLLVPVLCSLAISLAPLEAQAPGTAVMPAALPSPMPRPGVDHFRARREALRQKLGTGVAVLLGARKPDNMGAFSQSQDFFYLSGVDEPELAMLIGTDGAGNAIDELLVPPYSRFTAQWEGEFLAPGEKAAEKSGFAVVGNVRNLTGRLDEIFGADGAKAPTMWILFTPAVPMGGTPGQTLTALSEQQGDAFDGRDSREHRFKAAMEARFASVARKDLTRPLHALRAHKSPAEVQLLTRSAEIAAEGIAEAMKSSRPGLYEFQLAAVARYVFSLRSAGPDAYGAIVGTGKNGCVLHYMKNSAELQDGELVVMDYAPTVSGYASDVTRTFPVNGTFTDAQRKLVQDVYDVQQALIGEIKPGAKLSALSQRCSELLRARGYRSDHGPCHHVGLAVHDPSVDELEEGMVLTVEPGAYLRDQGMGCRIEDTILVTATGCEVLSKAVPSTPDAIEALMRESGLVDVEVGLPAGK